MGALRTFLSRAVLPVILMGGIPLGIQEAAYWMRYWLDIRPLRGNMRAYLDTYLDDQKLLAEESTFSPEPGVRNAAAFLNPRLEWLGGIGAGGDTERRITTEGGGITITESTRSRLRKWGPSFPKFHSHLDYSAYDFSWMKQIQHYDYWDILEGMSLDESFERHNAVGLFLTQTFAPAFEDLAHLAKLRLMKGLHDGEIDIAVSETRHFARLLYTTETLMGALAAIAVLRAENTVAEYLERTIQTHFFAWKPLDRHLLDRARRAALASNAFFTVFTPADTLAVVFEQPGLRIGLCSGLAKGMLRALLTRPLLEPWITGERGYAGAYATLDQTVEAASPRCRLTHLKALWADRNSRPVWLGVFGRNSWDWVNLHLVRKLPYARKAWGIDLASVFLSNGLDSYEKSLD